MPTFMKGCKSYWIPSLDLSHLCELSELGFALSTKVVVVRMVMVVVDWLVIQELCNLRKKY